MAVTSLILLPMLTATLTTTSMTAMVAFLVTSSAATDYCSITPKHTMCQYQVGAHFQLDFGLLPLLTQTFQGLGKACGGKSLRRGVSKILTEYKQLPGTCFCMLVNKSF